jgi:putative serine protease PepD
MPSDPYCPGPPTPGPGRSNPSRKEIMPTLFKNPKTMLAAATTSAALIGAGGVAVGYVAFGSDGKTVVRQVTVSADAESAASSATSSVSDIYKRTYKSVVEVTVSGAADASPFGSSGTQQAQGSGFVYDNEGHVITNQHVVDGAQSIKVTFWNGKTYDATVVGTDPSTDVAVLHVDAPASVLEPLSFADSSKLEVGDGVVAIGSPFGLEQTVTSGIVSALHRQITAPNDFAIDDAIQTDAAINHGNSGGPLLDMTGRVVGVTSQIESESGGNDGVGFAVSSNTVQRIADALISNGSVAHAYLGVATETSTSPAGATITTVRSGTPAAEAKLAAGDVVTAVDGEPVSSADQLRELVDAHKPGDSVTLTISRNGDTKSLRAVLGTRPNA